MPHHANATSFKKGHDPRRHRLTREERRRGYANAVESTSKDWDLHAWLWRRVRKHYDRQRAAAKGRRKARVA